MRSNLPNPPPNKWDLFHGDAGTIKAALRAEFGPHGWSIIQAKPSGRWWATRGPAPGKQVRPDASCFEADTPDELRAMLAEVSP